MASSRVLCLTLLALTLVLGSLTGVDARRLHKSRRVRGVNIEIYQPKGIMVSYPYRRGMELFGIEIFLNRQQNTGGSEVTCDICLNTTAPTFGKFILRDEDAVIRGGDHLLYNAIVKKVNCSAYVSRSNDFYVSESRIIAGSMPSHGSFGVASPVDVRVQGQVAPQANELTLLEEIIRDLLGRCQANQTQTNGLLLIRSTDTYMDAKELFQYTIETLRHVLPSYNWDVLLLEAYYMNDEGIVFKVPSYIDKLKILQSAKHLTTQSIIDVDLAPSDDFNNEIDMLPTVSPVL